MLPVVFSYLIRRYLGSASLVLASYTFWHTHLYLHVLISTTMCTCENGILNHCRCSSNKSRCGSQAGPERAGWRGATSAQPHYPFLLLHWSSLDCEYKSVPCWCLPVLLRCAALTALGSHFRKLSSLCACKCFLSGKSATCALLFYFVKFYPFSPSLSPERVLFTIGWGFQSPPLEGKGLIKALLSHSIWSLCTAFSRTQISPLMG